MVSRTMTLMGLIALCALPAPALAEWGWQDFFLSRDQQGQLLFARQRYGDAARRFEDPHWRALSLYAAQEFLPAADLWGQLPGAEALFNRGNALAHAKAYQGAIDSYTLALQLRPDWTAAAANLALVQTLAREAAALEEYVPQSEGKMAADDVTFERDEQRMKQALTDTGTNPGSQSTQEIQALWIERLQSTPADFLRLKFRYQHERPRSANVAEPTP